MRTFLPLTRGGVLAATGGEVPIFDCLECEGGCYAGHDQRPYCIRCGALAPDAVWALMRELLVSPRAA